MTGIPTEADEAENARHREKARKHKAARDKMMTVKGKKVFYTKKYDLSAFFAVAWTGAATSRRSGPANATTRR